MKRSITVILALIMLCGCSDQAAPRAEGMTGGSLSEDIISVQPESSNPSDISSSSTEEIVPIRSEELRRFVFNSAEDVKALSDDDLIYIANNSYRYSNSDLFSDISDGADLFGVPLLDKEINGKLCRERVETYLFQSELPIEELNVNEPIPDSLLREYADEHCGELISYSIWHDDTGRITKDGEIIYCGETDVFLEYSIRYTRVDTTRINGELVKTEMPNAHRRCFFKNKMMVPIENRVVPVYFGELSLESVKAEEDSMLSIYGGAIYRELSETDGAFVYSLYDTAMEPGDYGCCGKAYLMRYDIIYDKETHEITSNAVKLKETEIPGTEDWNEEVW